MLRTSGKWQAVEVGERHLQEFRLTTHPGSHRHIAVCSAGKSGIHRGAEAGEASKAVLAEATRNVERHDHAIANLAVFYGRSYLFDDAHILVTKHDSRFRCGATLIHVEVRATDTR